MELVWKISDEKMEYSKLILQWGVATCKKIKAESLSHTIDKNLLSLD